MHVELAAVPADIPVDTIRRRHPMNRVVVHRGSVDPLSTARSVDLVETVHLFSRDDAADERLVPGMRDQPRRVWLPRLESQVESRPALQVYSSSLVCYGV